MRVTRFFVFERLRILCVHLGIMWTASILPPNTLRHEAGIDTSYAVTADCANVNRDTEITILDATLIWKWLSDISVNCKIGEPI